MKFPSNPARETLDLGTVWNTMMFFRELPHRAALPIYLSDCAFDLMSAVMDTAAVLSPHLQERVALVGVCRLFLESLALRAASLLRFELRGETSRVILFIIVVSSGPATLVTIADKPEDDSVFGIV